MYSIELHDSEIDNDVAGTRVARIGRGGTIEYAYQVEIHIQDMLGDTRWRRAYLKTANSVKVVWVYDAQTGIVKYLARAEDYNGEWKLPFVASPNARIAVGMWGREATTDDQALAWATVQLSTAITAILMDRGDIRAAWELVDGTPQLVARGPQEQPDKEHPED